MTSGTSEQMLLDLQNLARLRHGLPARPPLSRREREFRRWQSAVRLTARWGAVQGAEYWSVTEAAPDGETTTEMGYLSAGPSSVGRCWFAQPRGAARRLPEDGIPAARGPDYRTRGKTQALGVLLRAYWLMEKRGYSEQRASGALERRETERPQELDGPWWVIR